MKIENPSGKKTIILKKSEKKQVFLEDFSDVASDFSLDIFLEGDFAEIDVIGRAQSMGSIAKKWDIKFFLSGRDQRMTLNLRGTAEDTSFLEFDGSVILEKSSIDGDVKISEKIVLFDQAKGKCLPVLTVRTDKVKAASHAATVSPFEKEKVLFCASRGIGKGDAENLLKFGFLK